VVCREGSQKVYSTRGSCFFGPPDGNPGPGTNSLSMYCELEAQHSVVRMIERLTFSGSIMGPLMIRAVMLQDPREKARQVATFISYVLK
jgi:hypothetical protein